MKLTYKRRSMYITIICSLATLLTTAVSFNVNAVLIPDTDKSKITNLIQELEKNPTLKKQLLEILQNQDNNSSNNTTKNSTNNKNGKYSEDEIANLVKNGNEYYDKKSYAEAIELYRKAAEQGNADAQNKLGYCYDKGLGVKQDAKEAFRWYQKAAEQGDVEAQCFIGKCYSLGSMLAGVEKNEKESFKWYQKAAEQGNAKAQKRIADCYFMGCGVEMDDAKAFRWYQKAAEQGDVKAQESLADNYRCGWGIEKDYEEAAKWYLKVVEHKNDVEILGKLADCYDSLAREVEDFEVEVKSNMFIPIHDDTSLKRSQEAYERGMEKSSKLHRRAFKWYQEAFKWHLKAAEQGSKHSMYELGSYYHFGTGVEEDEEEAFKWYRKAAEQGHTLAQNELGDRYYKGNGTKQDYKKAFEWYQKAADQGWGKAQNNLGDCYYKGNGTKQDYKKAFEWYQKAAEQENDLAQNSLGYCYEKGNGIDQDYEKAFEWYQKAAEQENALAQNNLGVCYANGHGVEKDYTEAIKWLNKAAEQGLTDAQNNLEILNNRLKSSNNNLNNFNNSTTYESIVMDDNLRNHYDNGEDNDVGSGMKQMADAMRMEAEQYMAYARQITSGLYMMPAGTAEVLMLQVELLKNSARELDELDRKEKEFFREMKNASSNEKRTEKFLAVDKKMKQLISFSDLQGAWHLYMITRRGIDNYKKNIDSKFNADAWIRSMDMYYMQQSLAMQQTSMDISMQMMADSNKSFQESLDVYNNAYKVPERKCYRCNETYYGYGSCPKCSAPKYSW